MKIKEKVKRLPKGKVLPLRFFMTCGSEPAVRTELSRLVKSGELMNVAQGFYARPKPNRFFGSSLPGPEEVAKEIARHSGELLAPHGAEVARRLGLSTQAPVQAAFYTTGRTRRIKVGNSRVYFEHAPERLVRGAGTAAGRALLALHHLGREHVTPEVLRTLSERVPVDELLQAKATPAWLRSRLKRLESGSIAA